MDANRGRNEYRWTNERHLRFLKSVEASFVRTMLENVNGDGRLLPMDRNLPDSCESTLDSKTATGTNRRKRHFPADNLDSSFGIDRKVKRLRLHQSSILPQNDQVVPQIELLKNNDSDENRTIST